MHIERAGALRGRAPTTGFDRSTAGAVDRIAVSRHPFPHFVQAIGERRLNLAFGIGPMLSRKLASFPAARTMYWTSSFKFLGSMSRRLKPHDPLGYVVLLVSSRSY